MSKKFLKVASGSDFAKEIDSGSCIEELLLPNDFKSHLHLNSRLPEDQIKMAKHSFSKALLNSKLATNHHFFMSSGSESGARLMALSSTALKNSAEAVNQRICSSKDDVWGLMLPTFHVGGFAVLLRAALSGSCVLPYLKWPNFRNDEACLFSNDLKAAGVSLMSLVPTQLFDVVVANLKAPSSLRAVFVGGGALSSELHLRARQLGWPIYASYGMTECASMVAVSERVDSLQMKPLPHVNVRESEDRLLEIQSSSLFGAECVVGDSNWSFRQGDWYRTSDMAEINGEGLKILGRASRFCKISGENVNLGDLEFRVRKSLLNQGLFLFENFVILSKPDERRGSQLLFVIEAENDEVRNDKTFLLSLDNFFKNQLAPFERPTQVCVVKKVPRSALGKIQYSELLKRC
jgi:O-succinylbenzoic acid--CoA ligase